VEGTADIEHRSASAAIDKEILTRAALDGERGMQDGISFRLRRWIVWIVTQSAPTHSITIMMEAIAVLSVMVAVPIPG
jgi:hypothetical protein